MAKRSVLDVHYGQIKTSQDLGNMIKAHRKHHHFTLEKISGLSNLGMRFLSEVERGKETAEIGKVLEMLNKMGLSVFIWPRGYEQTSMEHTGK